MDTNAEGDEVVKCLVANSRTSDTTENSKGYQASGKDDSCTDFKGSQTGINVFQILETPRTYFYPFEVV